MEKTSEGIKRGDVQGYSLYLGLENSVWQCVWHLAMMPLPVRWRVGIVLPAFVSVETVVFLVYWLWVIDNRDPRLVEPGFNSLGGFHQCRRCIDILHQWFDQTKCPSESVEYMTLQLCPFEFLLNQMAFNTMTCSNMAFSICQIYNWRSTTWIENYHRSLMPFYPFSYEISISIIRFT